MAKSLSRWHDGLLFEIYDHAKAGLTNSKIAKILGTTPATVGKWIGQKPALKKALARVRTRGDGGAETFTQYVYKRIPKHLAEIYYEIMAVDLTEKNPKSIIGLEKRLDALLGTLGKRARQNLFIHALVDSDFNASEAQRRMDVSDSMYKMWRKDPEFAELLDNIHVHKKNFFEGSLIGKVAGGDMAAIIFCNETVNADRGYSRKLDVNVKGNVNHNHTFDVDDLDLEFSVKEAIVEAMAKKRKADEVIDVESRPSGQNGTNGTQKRLGNGKP